METSQSPDQISNISKAISNHQEENYYQSLGFQNTLKKYEEMIQSVPRGKGWMTEHIHQYKGVWLSPYALKGILLMEDHFKARPTDIFLATCPKAGTTWLRALIFVTVTRANFDFSTHPLLTTGPHDCFPFLDAYIHRYDAVSLPSPRLLSTHFPYSLLPNSITASGCRFVYICRNPKDVLISKWVFMNKIRPKELSPLSLDEAFELFCDGVSHYGPYWDNVLGFWRASIEFPKTVLFLRYEDMKREPVVYVKKLAEFLGCSFTVEEENKGLVQEIIKMCSFEKLRNLDVNKKTAHVLDSGLIIDNNHFFRKGQIGDSKNHLTDDMIKRIDQISKEKLLGSGLTFGESSSPS